MSTDPSRSASGTNLTNRNGKVHARLTPGSDRYLCRSGERFGDPVSEGTTDSPVDCKRCLTRLEQQSQSVGECPASGDDFENWSTEQLRTELDTTRRILQNKRRYQLTPTLIAQLSGRRVRLEQALMVRAGTDKPRRGRVKSGTAFDMGREPGHPWPLEYAPRWTTDHHPWRIATAPGNGIRFAGHEVEESDVLGQTDSQPENSSG